MGDSFIRCLPTPKKKERRLRKKCFFFAISQFIVSFESPLVLKLNAKIFLNSNLFPHQVNENLGRLPMKDLYDNFLAFTEGSGRKISGHFTHDTMMEMVFCALGLYKEDAPLQALHLDPNRVWRTSYIGAFSGNIIAVLNR